ncbi:carbohydrate kinase family protein [Methanothermobacter sp.]|uniref:carbohydrate kinase family protein n=1 Tax=Methanothermobacter sp. TaxID=1884223 RepID=UPI00260C2B3E|nr:carbohydrate kinase family protein [Methanothermobacter sp.]MDI9615485.1 carbohydrate kinase family protein [Methanothermobacter sp.]
MLFDAVGLGALNMDQLHMVERIAGPDEEVFVSDAVESCGGSAANTITGLARLGLRTAFIGKVAGDREGSILRENLKGEGVADYIAVSGKGRSGRVMGFVDPQGNRALYVDPGVNDTLSMDEVREDALKTRLLHLTSFAGSGIRVQREVLEVIDDSVTVSLDPGHLYAERGASELEGILERTDILLVNRRELELMTGSTDPARASAELGVDVVVMKMGSEGVRAFDGSEVMVEALETTCRDTTGAGDAFNAGFLYAWLSGHGLEVSCLFGNYLASRCIEGYGATSSLPGREALEVLEGYLRGDVNPNTRGDSGK